MAVNKVELRNGDGTSNVLIDISQDTVTPETLMEGVTAHSANGELIVGTLAMDFATVQEIFDYLGLDTFDYIVSMLPRYDGGVE